MKNDTNNLPRCMILVNNRVHPDWLAYNPGTAAWPLGSKPQVPYYLPPQKMEAEVLTLNLNSGTMRVRIIDKDVDHRLLDISIDAFFESNKIEAK